MQSNRLTYFWWVIFHQLESSSDFGLQVCHRIIYLRVLRSCFSTNYILLAFCLVKMALHEVILKSTAFIFLVFSTNITKHAL